MGGPPTTKGKKPPANTNKRQSQNTTPTSKKKVPPPPGTNIFTADAVTMYPNIDTYEGVLTMGRFFEKKIAEDHPTNTILELLDLVLRNNMFIFGYTYWLQTKRTEMDTNSSVWYANFVRGFNEKHTLILKFKTNIRILR